MQDPINPKILARKPRHQALCPLNSHFMQPENKELLAKFREKHLF